MVSGIDLKKYRLIFYNIIVSAVLLLLINVFELRENYNLMLFYSFNSIFVFGFLILIELKHFEGLNLNLPLLVGYCFRLVLPSITNTLSILEGKHISFLSDANIVDAYLFPTVVWMNIYFMIFYCCFIKYKSNFTIEDSLRPFFHRYKMARLTIPLFVLGIIYKIVISFIPYELIPSIITTVFGRLSLMAIFIQMFDSLFSNRKEKKYIFISFVIISTWEAIVFGFYKGDIMMNFVYYGLYCFLDSKYHHKRLLTPGFIILCLSIFVVVDAVIYPFMTTKRIVAGWSSNEGGVAQNEYSNWAILVDVLQGNALSERGDNTTTGRMDSTPANAFFYGECCKKGLRTSEVAIDNIEMLVPRFIKPDKHSSQAGMMVYAYATTGSFQNIELASSNNFIGQFGSAYLIGGWLAAILLALLNSRFIMYYYNFLIKNDSNLIAIAFLLSLLLDSLLAFEESCDGGALFMGYSIFLMIGICLTSRFIPFICCLKK